MSTNEMKAKMASIKAFKKANPKAVQCGHWLYYGPHIMGADLFWQIRDDAARLRLQLNHHVVNSKPIPAALLNEAESVCLEIERALPPAEHSRIAGIVRTMMSDLPG